MPEKSKSESKKGKPSGAGRRKGKFDMFFAHTVEHKLRRVLRRNGARAAMAYVKSGKAAIAVLHRISKESNKTGDLAKIAFSFN
jgi:hypothetical protein